jgi:hypothetical protein
MQARTLAMLLQNLIRRWVRDRYEPARHYMRGQGPKSAGRNLPVGQRTTGRDEESQS